MQPFFQVKAHRFDSNLKIREMLAVLNQLELWRFVERDSDRWGVYVSSSAMRPKAAAVKILEDGGHYVVNVKYESTDVHASADWAKLQQELLDRILPAISASNIQPTAEYE